MRTYERNGVHVDQCADCRGIFLDRGELDRLIDAENTWHAGSGGQQAAAPRSGHERSGYEQSGHQQPSRSSEAGLGAVVSEVLGQVRGQKHSSHDRHYDDRRHQKKRKESFLGDLFG